MLDLLFFNSDTPVDEEGFINGETVSFTTDGYKLLIDAGFFSLLHVKSPQGKSAIPIAEFSVEIQKMLSSYPHMHTVQEMQNALSKYQYVTGDT